MAEKGINLEINDFKNSIVDLINSNKLPIIIKRQIANEICIELNNVTQNVILQEKSEYEQKLQEEKKNEEKGEK